MKYFFLLIIILAQAQKHKFNSEFLNLINTQSKLATSMDAVRAVMQLLEDLKNANEELDRKSDIAFADYEQGVLNDCSEFTKITNQMNASVEKNTEDLEAIDDKIAQTTDYLNWNEKRRKSNDYKLEELAEQRCEANSLFIEALRDYREALNVLSWVQSDLEAKDSTQLLQKEEVEEFSQKLQAYTSLFNPNDTQLIQTNENIAQQVVSEVIQKVQNLIEKIQDHIKGLEEQEITSANDFVDFKRNLLNEQEQLQQEYDGRQKFLNSLMNDKELAQDVVDQCVAILENSKRILRQTQDSYNLQKAKLIMEKQKRHEENQIIIEIMMLYDQKVAQAKEFIQKNGITSN
ncbi:hypothetical protein pb186bvf_007333 [Paramecium bursaria]